MQVFKIFKSFQGHSRHSTVCHGYLMNNVDRLCFVEKLELTESKAKTKEY